jgi:hypothetical protein
MVFGKVDYSAIGAWVETTFGGVDQPLTSTHAEAWRCSKTTWIFQMSARAHKMMKPLGKIQLQHIQPLMTVRVCCLFAFKLCTGKWYQ